MKQYVVDAFTDQIFHGNQAAVCVLEKWIPEELMMQITRENNFSETAFTVKNGEKYDLRWFTPGGEIDLCGHATLGAAYVLFRYYEKDTERIIFRTLSGDLFVGMQNGYITMDFPVCDYHVVPITEQMKKATGIAPAEAYIARDLLWVYPDEKCIRNMKPDFEAMKQLDGLGVCVTAKGDSYDCVSRFFAPKLQVNEDPVTGSAHCMVVPYWASRFGKTTLHAYQASERGGELQCELGSDRVILAGKAVLYAIEDLQIPVELL